MRVLNGEAVWGLQLSSLLNLGVLFRRWWLRSQALPSPSRRLPGRCRDAVDELFLITCALS
jgi:hypothetical protein